MATQEVRRQFTEISNELVELEFEVVPSTEARPAATGLKPARDVELAEPEEESTLDELRRETRQCYESTGGDMFLAIFLGTGLLGMGLAVVFITKLFGR